jgi:hypothetical protein
MSLFLKYKKVISNLTTFKNRCQNICFLNNLLLNSNTDKKAKKNEMEQLKDNPYFEKYKNKIKTAFE